MRSQITAEKAAVSSTRSKSAEVGAKELRVPPPPASKSKGISKGISTGGQAKPASTGKENEPVLEGQHRREPKASQRKINSGLRLGDDAIVPARRVAQVDHQPATPVTSRKLVLSSSQGAVGGSGRGSGKDEKPSDDGSGGGHESDSSQARFDERIGKGISLLDMHAVTVPVPYDSELPCISGSVSRLLQHDSMSCISDIFPNGLSDRWSDLFRTVSPCPSRRVRMETTRMPRGASISRT